MKLNAEIGDETVEVEIKRDGVRLFARVGDRNYELEATEPEPGVVLIKDHGKIYEVIVSNTAEGPESFQARIGADTFDVNFRDPRRLGTASAAHGGTDGIVEIRTAMPGKVVRILSPAGDAVKKGDGIIVVEAMKMQNEFKSPKDGTITEVRVAEGATVNAGDVLAVIE